MPRDAHVWLSIYCAVAQARGGRVIDVNTPSRYRAVADQGLADFIGRFGPEGVVARLNPPGPSREDTDAVAEPWSFYPSGTSVGPKKSLRIFLSRGGS